MKTLLIPALAVTLLNGCALDLLDDYGEDCAAETFSSEAIDATGIMKVRIQAEQGYLRVTGDSSVTEIGIEGRTCASHSRYLDDAELTISRQNNELIVTVVLPNSSQVKMDVTVTLPSGISVDATDGSGDVLIEYVQGDIYLRDGSGSILAEHVTGNIRLDDGSGGIRVFDADGDVTIDSDGSGSIELRQIDGNVSIGSDGSGDISAGDITGDFLLGRDGSGDVDLWNIQGIVTLP